MCGGLLSREEGEREYQWNGNYFHQFSPRHSTLWLLCSFEIGVACDESSDIVCLVVNHGNKDGLDVGKEGGREGARDGERESGKRGDSK